MGTGQEPGGPGGGYARKVQPVTPGQTIFYSVGAGGAPGATGGNSWANTSNTETGAFVRATGGTGPGTTQAVTAAGAGTAGDILFTGGLAGAQQGGGGGRAGSGGGGGAGSEGDGQPGSVWGGVSGHCAPPSARAGWGIIMSVMNPPMAQNEPFSGAIPQISPTVGAIFTDCKYLQVPTSGTTLTRIQPQTIGKCQQIKPFALAVCAKCVACAGEKVQACPHDSRRHPPRSPLASFTKHKSGWRAQVQIDGQRRSKVLPTRIEAKDWAARAEYEIRNGAKIAAAQPFGDVMSRYAREVSPTKRGERWEVIRLEKLRRDKIAKVPIADLAAPDFNDWRVRRMREVSPASVRREMGLMSAVLTVARKDWGLIDANPISDVTKPPEPPARDRLVTDDELKRLAVAAGGNLSLVTARAHHAFLFACETGMRAGEIVGLTWERVDLVKAVARLPMTKNGTARDVPLSKEAIRLLQALPKDEPVFGLTSRQLDSLFRKLRGMAAVEGLTFHDSRAVATTRLARKLDVLDLARMTGHKDLNMLIRVYYREKASDIAKRLD